MKGLKSKVFILLLLVVMCISTVAFAANESEISTISIKEEDAVQPILDEPQTPVSKDVDKDLFLMDSDITIDYNVNGNAFIMGDTVTISGKISGNAFILANTLNVTSTGYIYNDLFVCGKEVNVSGYVYDIYATTSKLTISSDATIFRDVSAGAQTFVLGGTIRRNANVSFDNATFGDSAYVGEDFNYSSSSKVEVPEDMVRGTINFTEADTSDNQTATVSHKKNYVWDAIKVLLISLVVILIVVLATPKFAEKEEIILTKKFGPALGYGALAIIAIPIACIILFCTVIGILPSIIVLLAYILFIAKLTYAFVAIPLGKIICKKLNKDSKGMNILFDCILVLAFWAIHLIPFVGGLVNLVINLLAFGIVTYTIFAHKKLNEENVVASASAVVEAKKDDSKK